MSAALPSQGNMGNLLMALVHRLERDDVATIEALLVDLVGNRAAAMMLRQLMRWWSKSTNADGWVYKSHVDWWAELRIKQNELPAANGALERVGVEIRLMKAEGAPTKHYRLDVKRFLNVLASTLKLPFKKLADLLKNAFRKRPEIDLPNGQKSITTNPPTIPPTDSAVLDTAIAEARKVQGIGDASARQLVCQYGPMRIRAAVALILSKHWRNPAGAFIQALREQWDHTPEEIQQPAPLLESSEPAKWADDGDPLVPIPLPPSPEGAVDDALLPEREAKEWATSYSQLEIQLDRASFDTWVRGARLGRVDSDRWTIYVTSKYAADMLQYRLIREVQRMVKDVANRPIELTFEVRPEVAREPESDHPLFKLVAQGA